ncbi:MAG: isocitrate/isopropylmalate dehydrogenase family protein [Lachnospiraceae bacterium]|nr:isocitrate/isopropylmalate dehydrogenase family protein [Lachnospiraceae bacterium]
MNKEAYIQDAMAQYEKVLRQQIARCEKMQEATIPKDFSALTTITIGLCGGDGIGPVIMEQARRLLEKLLKKELDEGKVTLKEIRGLTIENRMAKGEAVPAEVLEQMKACDVILKGPTTTPKGGTMESANVFLRRELDLYANVRPVRVPEEGIDWMFFRENTEGEYVLGSSGVEIPGDLAMDFKVITDCGTKRIARAAFEFARKNGKNQVAIVTKANIMKKTDGKFSKICNEVAKAYPEVNAEDWYIDIMTANLVNKEMRRRFQVFVLPNLYGDIITDEAAQIQGGVGTAGSANLGDQYAMFEAIHGSAPRMVEEGLAEYANPSSIFKAVEMMLRHIGLVEHADKLEQVLQLCCETEKKLVVTGTKEGSTCKDFAEYVLGKID